MVLNNSLVYKESMEGGGHIQTLLHKLAKKKIQRKEDRRSSLEILEDPFNASFSPLALLNLIYNLKTQGNGLWDYLLEYPRIKHNAIKPCSYMPHDNANLDDSD